MSEEKIAKLVRELRAERWLVLEALAARVASERVLSADQHDQPMDDPERGSDLQEIDLSETLAERSARRFEDLTRALDRALQGRFGSCDGCGESIPLARLEALPTAALCLLCADQREAPTAAPARVPPEGPGLALPGHLVYTNAGEGTVLRIAPFGTCGECGESAGRSAVAADEIRWFEFEPGYVLHMVNAWEEGDWIVMDGCLQPDPTIQRRPEEGRLASMLGYLRIRAHLHRWSMNLVTGETREADLDDLNVEFCLPDTDLYGTRTRYSYHQHLPPDSYTVDYHALVKYDHEDGSCVRYDYGEGKVASEAPFAPRVGGTGEDDGYVVTVVSDVRTLDSECWVFSARDIASGEVWRTLITNAPPGKRGLIVVKPEPFG